MRTLVKILLIGVVVIAGFYFLMHNPILISEKTRRNMLEIQKAVIEYDLKHKRLPSGLFEIVEDGLLAERSEFFVSPLRRHTIWNRPIHFHEVEFKLTFSPEKFNISADDNAFQLDYEKGSARVSKVN